MNLANLVNALLVLFLLSASTDNPLSNNLYF